jgi:multisubunit Na+/H+ antiporter MnhB subunit
MTDMNFRIFMCSLCQCIAAMAVKGATIVTKNFINTRDSFRDWRPPALTRFNQCPCKLQDIFKDDIIDVRRPQQREIMAAQRSLSIIAAACTRFLLSLRNRSGLLLWCNHQMAFRGMDTMLEKVVLLLAIVGIWSLAPDRAWGGRPGPRHQADPNGVLAFLARLLPPAGIVVAIYILWTGADHPGGAFQGGAVLASMWLLVIMAGLADTPPVSSRWLRLILVVGPGLFLVIGLGGLGFGPAFLAYPAEFAKPLILGIEVAMILTIAATLALLLAGAPERSA